MYKPHIDEFVFTLPEKFRSDLKLYLSTSLALL